MIYVLPWSMWKNRWTKCKIRPCCFSPKATVKIIIKLINLFHNSRKIEGLQNKWYKKIFWFFCLPSFALLLLPQWWWLMLVSVGRIQQWLWDFHEWMQKGTTAIKLADPLHWGPSFPKDPREEGRSPTNIVSQVQYFPSLHESLWKEKDCKLSTPLAATPWTDFIVAPQFLFSIYVSGNKENAKIPR